MNDYQYRHYRRVISCTRIPVNGYQQTWRRSFFPVKKKEKAKEEKYALLDHRHAKLNELTAIYLELLSIGQFLAESDDTKRYLDSFRTMTAVEGHSST